MNIKQYISTFCLYISLTLLNAAQSIEDQPVTELTIHDLINAIRDGNSQIFNRCLLNKKIDIEGYESDERDDDSMYDYKHLPTHQAASYGQLDMLKVLASKGADLTKCDSEGQTLLHMAVSSQYKETIKYLCDKELNVNARDDDEVMPIDIAVDTQIGIFGKMMQARVKDDDFYYEDYDEILDMSHPSLS